MMVTGNTAGWPMTLDVARRPSARGAAAEDGQISRISLDYALRCCNSQSRRT